MSNHRLAHRIGVKIRSRRSLLSGILLLAAVIFILTRLEGSLPLVGTLSQDVGISSLLGCLVSTIVSLLFQAAYHATILQRISDSPVPRRKVVRAYLQSQIIRYLPGKILGVLYQSDKLRSFTSPAFVILANIFQTVISATLTVAMIIAAFSYISGQYYLIFLALIFLLAVELFHRRPDAESALFRILSRVAPSLRIGGHHQSRPLPWKGSALLCGEWIAYLLGFLILLHAVSGPVEALIFGVWYAGASLIATAAFVVPAGIAVREAIFLSLPESTGFSIALLATTAILMRAIQISADLLLSIAAMISWERSANGE